MKQLNTMQTQQVSGGWSIDAAVLNFGLHHACGAAVGWHLADTYFNHKFPLANYAGAYLGIFFVDVFDAFEYSQTTAGNQAVKETLFLV